MEDQVNAAEFEADPTQEGTGDGGSTASIEGQPNEGVSGTGGEPTGVEGLPEDWTPETLTARHKDYTSLQKEFGERNDATKVLEERFSPYGGVDKLIESAQYLSNNPRFQEFVKSEQERSVYGDNQEVTDENREAMDIVNKMVDAKVSQLLNDRVIPLENSRKERALNENFERLDAELGEGWREQKDAMNELAKTLAPGIQDNPSYENIQDLYWNALRRNPAKFEAAQADAYKRKLESTKSKSTEKPGSAPAGRLGNKITNMADAYKAGQEAG